MEMKIHTNPDGSTISVPASAVIGKEAHIAEGASIGKVAIISERVVIRRGADIRKEATIEEWAVIGEWARRHAVRSDGYVFTVGERDGKKRIFAGCRDFSEAQAREHWGINHKHHAETTAILDFLFR